MFDRKKFRKLAAATAMVFLAASTGFLIAAETAPSAAAFGFEDGPCITAVWKDDPTIRAQRGNCQPPAPSGPHNRTDFDLEP